MNACLRRWCRNLILAAQVVCLLALFAVLPVCTLAQEQPAAPAAAAPAATPPAAPAAANVPFRKLAPGVETTIPAEIKPEETFTVQTILDQPNVRVPQATQCLEFTFKPLRFVRVQLPDAKGLLTEKLVWYLVYHVKQPVIESLDAEGNPIPPRPMRFYPVFWLEDLQSKKVYRDRLIASAIPVIQRREDPNRVLLNSAEIAGEIAPSPAGEDHSRWGVVTWDDIDLRINRFALYVGGLSNAYKIPTEVGQEGKLLRKTLVVHFWRPGDAFYEHESEIRLGIPGDVDYRWIYR